MQNMDKIKVNPQLEDGYTKIVNAVQEALCRTHFGGYERRVLDVIIRKTWGFGKKEDRIPNSQICKMTGLYKSHVSRALTSLILRRIVTKNGNKLSVQKDYTLWTTEKLPILVTTKKLPKMVTEVTKNGNKKLPKMADSKETTKEILNNVNVINNNNKNKNEYYARLISEKLNDTKSLSFYIKACSNYNPEKLLEKAHAIIADHGAKNPGAVFVAWYLSIGKEVNIRDRISALAASKGV